MNGVLNALGCQVIRRLRPLLRRWRRWMLLGPQERDKLRNLLIAQRVAEGRHLRSAVQNMIGHFLGWPAFVVANLSQSWRLLCSLQIGAMAKGAALVAEERGAGFHVRWSVSCESSAAGKNQYSREEFDTRIHLIIFA